MNHETILKNINENKYLIGLMMITVTVGGRFIIGELNEKQKKNINNKTLRRLFVFGVFFMATRDIVTSIILTIVFVLTISELLNDGDDEMNQGEYSMNDRIEGIQTELEIIKSQI